MISGMTKLKRLEHKRFGEFYFAGPVTNLPVGVVWQARSKLKTENYADFPENDLVAVMTAPVSPETDWVVTISKPPGVAQAEWPVDETVLCDIVYFDDSVSPPRELPTDTFKIFIEREVTGPPDV